MGLPPAIVLEKAPEEELPRPDPQALEPASRDLDPDGSRRLFDYARDTQPVTRVPHKRDHHAEPDERREHDGVKSGPVRPSRGIADEVLASRELMAEGEGDRQVAVEVDEVPALIAQAEASNRGRRDPDGQEHDEG